MYTRRELGKLAIAALPGAGLLRRTLADLAQQSKPNSKFAGVQVGLNVPYSFGDMATSADEILAACVRLGLSAVEMRSQPIEIALGASLNPAVRGAANATAALRTWRLSTPMDAFGAFRRKYEDAGVLIEIVKVDGIDSMTDDVVDYCFAMASAVGARAISCEIPLSKTKRLGEFADKHRMVVAYHGHDDVTNPEAFATPRSWETAMSYAKYNGINLDLGHFVAGNNASPVEFIKRHHDRITHVHVKDRKMNKGPNVPFGQGDTPITEVLRLIRDNKWRVQATIDFEYPVPPGSDRMTEIAKCLQYCKDALA